MERLVRYAQLGVMIAACLVGIAFCLLIMVLCGVGIATILGG